MAVRKNTSYFEEYANENADVDEDITMILHMLPKESSIGKTGVGGM